MSIHIKNYEEFVIDYLEGNLDSIKTEEMKVFLLIHPDIAMELEELNELKLEKEPRDKTSFLHLKQKEIISQNGITENNYEEYFIAYQEQDLSEEESANLLSFIHLNPELSNEFDLSQMLLLKADTQIIFETKNGLKKSEKTIYYLWPYAASVAAILLLAFWLIKPEPQHPIEVLQTISSKPLIALSSERPAIILQQKMITHTAVYFPEENTEVVIRDQAPPKYLASFQTEIILDDNQWQNEMLLMQSFAFDRNQLLSQLEFTEEKPSAWQLISSFVWKTTKGQVKNIGININDDFKTWQANKIEQVNNDFISIKGLAKEQE